ncbi:MAG: hypothetical protein ABI691_19750 [Ginsengibacter sp.]
MNKDDKLQSRKKFIGVGISTAALFTAFRFFVPKKKKTTNTIKMLSQNGELVEVDIAALPAGKKKITNNELKNWIKK